MTQERARKRKTLQECAEIILTEKKLVGGKQLTGAEAMMFGIFQKALRGDVAAAKFIRETIGEDPAQKIELSGSTDIVGNISINITEAKAEK